VKNSGLGTTRDLFSETNRAADSIAGDGVEFGEATKEGSGKHALPNYIPATSKLLKCQLRCNNIENGRDLLGDTLRM